MKRIWIRNVSVYSLTTINLIQMNWNIYSSRFYLNKMDNGSRINQNVSNSNLFHAFLDLLFLDQSKIMQFYVFLLISN